jgi:hypothetical protein
MLGLLDINPDATIQQAFDFALGRMFVQNRRCLSTTPQVNCSYTADNDSCRCAVGHLLPKPIIDEIIKNGLEAHNLIGLGKRVKLPPLITSRQTFFWLQFQTALHDGVAGGQGFRAVLLEHAREFIKYAKVTGEVIEPTVLNELLKTEHKSHVERTRRGDTPSTGTDSGPEELGKGEASN